MHEVGFDGVAVVIADEVKNAVGHEQLQLQVERDAEAARLALRGVERDHDLTDERGRRCADFQGEGEDVRPPSNPTEGAIELADFRVADQGDFDGPRLATDSPERPLGGPHQRAAGDA